MGVAVARRPIGGFVVIPWALGSVEGYMGEMSAKRNPRNATIGLIATSIRKFPLLCGFWRMGVAVARHAIGGFADIRWALG